MKIEDPRFRSGVTARDPQALDLAVRSYLPHILRAARGAGLSPEAAEDVTQMTFTTFIEKAAMFEGRSSVRTWLFGIFYHKLQEHYRRTRREMNLTDIEDVSEALFDTKGAWVRPPRVPDEFFQDVELGQHLQACLEATPERHRIAFVLREIDEMPTPDICAVLNVTRTNLGVMLMRIRNRLRECLELKGVREKRHAEL